MLIKALYNLVENKGSLDLKSSERDESFSTVRGFSTDQRISIESMNIQKESVRDRKRESKMAALSIQQSSINNLLNQAEIRATNRCPSYDKNNSHWKRVDSLIEEQDRVMKKLLNFDKDEDNLKSGDGYVVSDFINPSSPVKKCPLICQMLIMIRMMTRYKGKKRNSKAVKV